MVKILRDLMKKTPADSGAKKASPEEDSAEKDREEYLRNLKLIGSFAGIADTKGKMRFAREAPIKELGYTEEEILKRPFWEAEWFKGSERSQKAIKDGMDGAAKGQTVRCEVEAFTKDGKSLPVILNIGPLKGEENLRIIGIVAETEPISLEDEVGQAEADKKAEEGVMPILGLIKEAYFKADAANRITMVNDYAAKLLGYESPDEVIGKKMSEFWARPEERDRYLMQLSRKSTVSNYEATLRKRDGTQVIVELEARLFSDSGGEVQGSEGLFRDITAVKELEAARASIAKLEVSGKRYGAVLDNIDEGVVLLEEGVIRFMNARFAQMLQRKPQEIEGTAFISHLSPASAQVEREMASVKEPPTEYEVEVVRKDGEAIQVQVSSHWVEYNGGAAHMLLLREIIKTETVEQAPEPAVSPAPEGDGEMHTDLLEKIDCGAIILKGDEISFVSETTYDIIGRIDRELRAARKRQAEGFTIIREFLGQDTVQELAQRHKNRAPGDDGPWVMHLEVASDDDATLTMELRGSAVRYRGDQAELVLLRILTDEKLALEEVRKSEEYLKTVLGSTGAGIVVVDPVTHKIVDANTQAVEMTGLPQDQLLGHACHGYVCPAGEGQCPVTDLKQEMKMSPQTLPRSDGGETRLLRTVVPAVWQDHTYLIESLVDISHVEIDHGEEEPIELGPDESYKNAVEAAPDVILNIDPQDEKIVSANPAFERITGWPHDRWIGRTLSEVIHSEDIVGLRKEIQMSLRGGASSPLELRFLSASGEYLASEAVVVSRVEGEERTTFMFLRKSAERKKEDSERKDELLQALIESVSEGIHVAAADGTLRYESPSMQGMFGHEPAQMIGRSVFEFVHPKDAPEVIDTFKNAAQTPGAAVPLAFRFLDNDGSWRSVKATLRNLLHNPAVGGIVITYRLVAEPVQPVEAPVQDADTRFRSLIDNAHEGIQIVDPHGIIQYASPGNEAIFGHKPSELVGKNAFSAIHPTDAPRIVGSFHHLMQHPGSAMSLECKFMHKDGSWHYLQASAASLLHDAAVDGIVFSYYDVTERKNIEAELQASQDQLTRAMEQLRMSHDEVSAPVVQIWSDILALPLIGLIDAERARKIADALLTKIVDTRSQIVILDVSGVTSMDAKVIGHLVKTVQSSRLLGAECVVTGIDPDIASEMEAVVGKRKKIVTKVSLQEGLTYALSKIGCEVAAVPAPKDEAPEGHTTPHKTTRRHHKEKDKAASEESGSDR